MPSDECMLLSLSTAPIEHKQTQSQSCQHCGAMRVPVNVLLGLKLESYEAAMRLPSVLRCGEPGLDNGDWFNNLASNASLSAVTLRISSACVVMAS